MPHRRRGPIIPPRNIRLQGRRLAAKQRPSKSPTAEPAAVQPASPEPKAGPIDAQPRVPLNLDGRLRKGVFMPEGELVLRPASAELLAASGIDEGLGAKLQQIEAQVLAKLRASSEERLRFQADPRAWLAEQNLVSADELEALASASLPVAMPKPNRKALRQTQSVRITRPTLIPVVDGGGDDK